MNNLSEFKMKNHCKYNLKIYYHNKCGPVLKYVDINHLAIFSEFNIFVLTHLLADVLERIDIIESKKLVTGPRSFCAVNS